MKTVNNVDTTATQQKPMVQVGISSFPLGLRVPYEVFKKDAAGYSRILEKWTQFTQEIRDELRGKGIIFLYVEGDPVKVRDFFAAKPALAAAPVSDETYNSYARDKEQYHQVSRLVFTVGEKVNFSIFNVDELRYVPVLTADASRSATVTDAVKTAKGNLAVKMSDLPLYRAYIAERNKQNMSLSGDRAAVTDKVAVIKEDVKLNIRDFLSDPVSAKSTQGVIDSANTIINVMKLKEGVMQDLLTLRAGDFHLYNHSSNVAVFATGMAVAMGMNSAETENLTIAAAMHDIGKTRVPREVLNKRTELTPQELSLLKRHVNEGVTILQNKGLSRNSLNAVQQHHERLTGFGYPYGLKGGAITTFGRIMAIADHYDNLMTPRPLKPVMTPYMVLESMLKDTEKGEFDKDLMKLFVNILKEQRKI
jgi:putative nucleotidyltransferase with HDIG domain